MRSSDRAHLNVGAPTPTVNLATASMKARLTPLRSWESSEPRADCITLIRNYHEFSIRKQSVYNDFIANHRHATRGWLHYSARRFDASSVRRRAQVIHPRNVDYSHLYDGEFEHHFGSDVVYRSCSRSIDDFRDDAHYGSEFYEPVGGPLNDQPCRYVVDNFHSPFELDVVLPQHE